MNLTEHFDSKEFLVSRDYPELIQNHAWKDIELERLFYLCTFALEPIRAHFGPVLVTSGVRTQELNKLIGGSPTSQHIQASACDFVCPSTGSMRAVYRWCLEVLKWEGEVFYYARAGHCHIGLPRLGRVADHGVFEDK